MILQALNSYYQRMDAHQPGALAPYGLERKSLPVIIELDHQGGVHQINISKDKQTPKLYVLPKAVKRASGIAANLLWDNAEYVLGLPRPGGKAARVAEQHQAFVERLRQLRCDDVGVQALLSFMASLDLVSLQQRPDFDAEFFATNPNVSFQLADDTCLICERPAVREAALASISAPSADDLKGFCLVSGESASIERLHPSIKGVWGAQSSGANIVSFNLTAFSSFAKSQGANSPVGKRAGFQYTEALNYLLRKGSRQRLQIGDASTVFWAEEAHEEIEDAFQTLMGSTEKDETTDDPNQGTSAVKAALQAFYKGSRIDPSDDKAFYILGLAPNASRIAIRFWQVSNVRAISRNVCQHYKDISIVHPANTVAEIALPRLLSNLCLGYKLSNLPPNLAGEVARSIFTNSPYPISLLAAAVRRNKAERHVSFPRAAIIKACLNRNSLTTQEITMALDLDNTDTAYLLGRWFATLEKIQEESHPGINATIKDRYYGAISSSPVSVFGALDKLKNHHLSKLENTGAKVNKERLLGEIIAKLPANLPNQLALREQATFAIGYYHQRQDFFTPKSTNSGDQS